MLCWLLKLLRDIRAHWALTVCMPVLSSGLVQTICSYATLKTLWHLPDLISKDNARWGKMVLSHVRYLRVWQAYSGKSVELQNLYVSHLPPSPCTRSYSVCWWWDMPVSACMAVGVLHTRRVQVWEQEGMWISSSRNSGHSWGILCLKFVTGHLWEPPPPLAINQTNANNKLPTLILDKGVWKTLFWSFLESAWRWEEMLLFLPSLVFCSLSNGRHILSCRQPACLASVQWDRAIALFLATSGWLSMERTKGTTEQGREAQGRGTLYSAGSLQGIFLGKCQPVSCIQWEIESWMLWNVCQPGSLHCVLGLFLGWGTVKSQATRVAYLLNKALPCIWDYPQLIGWNPHHAVWY